MPYPPMPRFPETLQGASDELEASLTTILQYMWNELVKPFNAAGQLPLAICDSSANQGNYPAKNYPEGALYFANDTHHLFVDSYLGGTPTWVQVV